MNADDFRHFWQQKFPNCPPVSWLFKWRLEELWFRFHSLPESKRYADNENEYAEILRRQNTVLLDVIGEDNECVLVSGNYSSSPTPKEECSGLSRFDFKDLLTLSRQDFDSEFEPDEESVYLNLFCVMHKLKHGSLDDILLCIAEEQTRNFFIVNCERKRIFAPYDGGVDVILKNEKERDEFKTKYKDWLSPHPLGY